MVALNAITAGMDVVGIALAFTHAWGLWQMIVVLGETALVRSADLSALVKLTGLLRLIAGLVIGVLMLFVLVERAPGPRPRD
jgi:hypothetical protein